MDKRLFLHQAPQRWLTIVAIVAGGVAWAGMMAGCDSRSRDERAREQVRQDTTDRDEQNRWWQEARQRKLATVERYKGWFKRLTAMDHAALGLPDPEPLPDGSIPPATRDETFCQRLAALSNQPPELTPEQWLSAYREQATRWRVASFPQSYEEYRALYLAERQLARLACIARDGSPTLRRALLDCIGKLPTGADDADTEFEPGFESFYISPSDVDETMYYTAAVYAIKHGLDPEAGWNALRTLRDGETLYSLPAKTKLSRDPPPLSLNFDANHEYDMALWWLRENRDPPKRLRAGKTHSVMH
ncbi:hypothetical protein [Haliangium sp.]|uniref:hypothetical protein n=1 Tax=Haliangium sp. TaxID=2663208 RepID=UPI003D10F62E